jgi:hypothetical protein
VWMTGTDADLFRDLPDDAEVLHVSAGQITVFAT